MMSERKTYDPIEDIKDMELNKDAWLGMYSLHDAIMVFCGVMLIIGFVTNWVSYVNIDRVISYAGWNFARDAGSFPEVWLVFMLGIFFIVRPVLSAYLRKSTYLSIWPEPIITIIGSIIGLIVPLEIFYRYAPTLKTDIGIAFLNNAGIGWYLSISASLILLIAGILVFIESYLNRRYRDRALAERQARFGVGYVPSEVQYRAPPVGYSVPGQPPSLQPVPGQQGAVTSPPGTPPAYAPPQGVAMIPPDQLPYGYGAPQPSPPQQMPMQGTAIPSPGQMAGQVSYGVPPPGSSPFGPPPADPKARKKYEKALRKWQEMQARGRF
jgi:hypothetical protein